jgi:hypothetical protein
MAKLSITIIFDTSTLLTGLTESIGSISDKVNDFITGIQDLCQAPVQCNGLDTAVADLEITVTLPGPDLVDNIIIDPLILSEITNLISTLQTAVQFLEDFPNDFNETQAQEIRDTLDTVSDELTLQVVLGVR